MAEPQSSPRRGLGRGLSALLEETNQPLTATVASGEGGTSSEQSRLKEVPIEWLHPNPDQPRRYFDEAELDELTASIREKGLLQPILVRPHPTQSEAFQIVAGERRWRASQKALLHQVPVLIQDLNDSDVLEIGIIENVQRTDLNPLEEASGYKALMDRFDRTQDAVALTVGKSRSHVANMLRLLQLPEKVRQYLAEGKLSAGHARAIATLPHSETLADLIVKEGLSVRQVEQLVRRAQKSTASSRECHEDKRDSSATRQDRPAGSPSAPTLEVPDARAGVNPDVLALEQDLSTALGLEIRLVYQNGNRGELRIAYQSLEQLDFICRILTTPPY